MDDVLDLVAAAQILATLAQRLDLVVVDGRLLRPRRAFAILVVMMVVGVIVMIVAVVIPVIVVILGVEFGAQRGLFGGMLGLFAQQGFAIFLGNLVIVGVDFRKGQEAVTIAAVSTNAACSDGSTRVTLAR